MNVSDLVTWCEEHLITDEVDKLTSQRVFIAVIRPGRVHKLQRVGDKVCCFTSIIEKKNETVLAAS